MMTPRGINNNADEVGYIAVRSGNPKKEWPIVRILAYLILVAFGVVLGVVTTFHMTRYLGTQNMFSPLGKTIRPPTPKSAPCRVKNEGLMDPLEHLINPKFVKHNMSDAELLWRASLVPSRSQYPFERVPKIAFLFLAKGPMPLIPLWEKFLQGHAGLYSIYVHSLPSFKLEVSKGSPFYQRQIPSQAVQWGQSSMVDAERRLVANALLDFSNERFVLLSETCIPLFNFTTVYNYLIQAQHSFVHSFDDPSQFGRGRYNRNMAPQITLRQWRKGSQWFEVNRKLAIIIISDTKYYPMFKTHCKPSCYVDEHYIPTLVNMGLGSYNSDRSITWVDWSRGGSHPAMFGKGDITERFLRSIRDGRKCKYNDQIVSTCHLFARKFAPSTLDTLLKMASNVLEFR